MIWEKLGFIIAYAASTDAGQIAVKEIVDTNGRETVGGGEILTFFKFSDIQSWVTMNGQLIRNIEMLPLIKFGICVLIFFILAMCVMHVVGLGQGLVYSGVESEISNITRLRKRDTRIIRKNKQLAWLTRQVNDMGLGVDLTKEKYLKYLLKRADIKNPGGQRVLEPSEYNARIKGGMFLCIIIGALVGIGSITMGAITALLGCMAVALIPDILLKELVEKSDRIIKNNFFDFYGEIYYPMLNDSETPLVDILRTYAKVDLVDEMRNFTNNIADTIDLHGDYMGAKKVQEEYGNIPEVQKLMRLIQQYNDGADVKQDMKGFREQLLLRQQQNIDKNGEKIIRQARSSFTIIYLILFQAIGSAVAIYFPDLGSIGNMFGG